ncbi:MAG: nucleotidyltransferase family protein [Hyphomicrobiaceae bacterium]|nr:nucleotidyltransferase family protein [Hyphomicrobiaceae bacterium]
MKPTPINRTKITTAMTLAAGFGKRMRPLTDDRPKPMVELDGRPMIDHVLARLATAGIRRTIVNLHYQADVLENHLKARNEKPDILFSSERDTILDTGGGIKRALPLLGDQPFVLHNSDSVWIENGIDNIARLMASYDPEKMDCLLLMAPTKTSLGYDGAGDFFIEADGRLRRRTQDETSPNVFTGVSIQHPRLFDDSPQGAFSVNILWDRAIAKGRVYGIPFEGLWMHVGTPKSLAEATEALHDAS